MSDRLCSVDGLDPLERLVFAVLLLLLLLPMTIIASQHLFDVARNLWGEGQYLQAIAFLLTLSPLWFIIVYAVIHLVFAIMCMRR